MTNTTRKVYGPLPALAGPFTKTYSQTFDFQLVKKVTQIQKRVLEQQPTSDMVANHQYSNVDASWAMRSAYSNDLLDGGLRQTTFIPAIITWLKSFKSGKKAEKIGDQTGTTLSRLDKVGSGIQMGYALTGIAGKVTSLWLAFRPNPTIAAIGTVIGKMIGCLAIPLYVMPAISGAYQAFKARQLYTKYEGTFKSLVELIYVQKTDIESMKDASKGNTLPRVGNFRALAEQELREQGLNPHTTPFDEAIEALGLTTYEEYYLPRYTPDLKDNLSVLGFLLAIKNKQEANETEMTRAFGADCVALIKKSAMTGLQARLDAPNGKVQEKAKAELRNICNKIEANYTQIQRINVTLSILSTLTVILGCVSVALVITNPIGLIASAAAWTLIALLWVIFDVYVAEQFEGRPGKYDKLLVQILTAILVIGGVISIAGAAIAGSPVTLALAAALFSLLLGYSIYSLHRIDELETKWVAAHPTLKDLHNYLTKETPPKLEDAYTLFKRLSKLDRINITEQAQLAPIDIFSRSLKDILKDENNIPLLKRAAAKAANHHWTAYGYRSTDRTARACALKLQEFFYALEDNRLEYAENLYKKLGESARQTLQTQIRRVFKRDSSVDALRLATAHQVALENA